MRLSRQQLFIYLASAPLCLIYPLLLTTIQLSKVVLALKHQFLPNASPGIIYSLLLTTSKLSKVVLASKHQLLPNASPDDKHNFGSLK